MDRFTPRKRTHYSGHVLSSANRSLQLCYIRLFYTNSELRSGFTNYVRLGQTKIVCKALSDIANV